MSKPISSPLYSNGETKHLYDIQQKEIIKAYNGFGIDVSYLLKNHPVISVYECIKTQYKFYYPFDVAGDSKFYEHFQNFDWYYMPWKWEHEITKEYLKDGLSVLEVGCAHGAFLKKINELYQLEETVGLELNETTPNDNEKWKIVNQFVQDYQINNNNKYDIVCSYQVLEHIADVHSFIEANVNCLKIGGKLIISVPNNESFIKDSRVGLNMPPHHMGLWDTKSLESLVSIFPLKIVKVHYEELQQYHVEGYINSNFYAKYPKIVGKILRKLHKITGKYKKYKAETELKRDTIIGHTILAVYEKI